MTSNPKRPPSLPPPGGSNRPAAPTGQTRPPSNLRDALTEAQAIAGGGLARPSTAPPSMKPTGRKVILVVDDDAVMRTNLRRALEQFYDVVEAKDGMEAVELASKIPPPAMLVCDVVMPRVDGFTLAKIFRGNPVMKKVPIMFVSSRNSPQEVTHALVLGACQYVPKTTPVTQIVEKIKKILLT